MEVEVPGAGAEEDKRSEHDWRGAAPSRSRLVSLRRTNPTQPYPTLASFFAWPDGRVTRSFFFFFAKVPDGAITAASSMSFFFYTQKKKIVEDTDLHVFQNLKLIIFNE